MLLDCGAMTIYVSQRWVEEHHLQTTQFDDKNIRVKLGDNQIIKTELEVLPLNIMVSGIQDAYNHRSIGEVDESKNLNQESALGANKRGLRADRGRRTGDCLRSSGICRGTALETDVTPAAGPTRNEAQEKSPGVVCEQQEDAPAGKGSAAGDGGKSSGRGGTAEKTEGISSARGKDNVEEKMFRMGVIDESGVQTKYITRKKLRKFLRIKTKSEDEPAFMLVLTNETIKQVARSLQRRDQPDNIATAKAQLYLETDWDKFRSNPAFDLLVKYKDNVYRPELP
ncbi:hypothetical protein PC119_g17901 [Phytophthora cactorum]|uniref:Uncharacterized protein n=2 Tax=Phytophthora cactorum TaxID=29920 RepID=A0A8T1CAE0_9STRA|nr:hypothetical protein PC112_g16252 [Phytophthora cactorum]KAG2882444.1 hypothetical protein PC114_g21043 [Phytophthora cactorum]KAG2917920.1 hypothetical protein PC117_g17258 [Phytophthora cactorum]KAG2996188.1 hypothetical protein PC119_g17901 [Phytophthora cactorum]